MAIIKHVPRGSIAHKMGLMAQDDIISVNGEIIRDVLDYRFACAEDALDVVIKRNGRTERFHSENPDYRDLGVGFETGLIDSPARCSNKCVFCFVDQLPANMRDTLYFKDDDARLSFLQGNYITMTNLDERELDRICRMRVSPINISVHTTDPALRTAMLGNKRAANILRDMKRLADNRISMNCQIVACPGLNHDISQTVNDLLELYPAVHSLSVVPVGLTRHRRGLYELNGFDAEGARRMIQQVDEGRARARARFGAGLVYAADEFYLMAGLPIPRYEYYDDFPQIENGVGMIAALRQGFSAALDGLPNRIPPREAAVITGRAAAPLIKSLAKQLEMRYNNLRIHTYPIRNDFFGEAITVAGLVTGRDIVCQLGDSILGEEALIPRSMLRHEGDVFLDDMTIEDVGRGLNTRVKPSIVDGAALAYDLIGVERDC